MDGKQDKRSSVALPALVVAILAAIPIVLAFPPAQAAVAWSCVMLVFLGTLRLFGTRSVIEMGVFIVVLSGVVAIGGNAFNRVQTARQAAASREQPEDNPESVQSPLSPKPSASPKRMEKCEYEWRSFDRFGPKTFGLYGEGKWSPGAVGETTTSCTASINCLSEIALGPIRGDFRAEVTVKEMTQGASIGIGFQHADIEKVTMQDANVMRAIGETILSADMRTVTPTQHDGPVILRVERSEGRTLSSATAGKDAAVREGSDGAPDSDGYFVITHLNHQAGTQSSAVLCDVRIQIGPTRCDGAPQPTGPPIKFSKSMLNAPFDTP